MAYTTIDDPTIYFNTVLYTGANKTVSVGFEPSFSWIKERDVAGHALFDAVRGATKLLESNDTAAENTQSTSLTAFTSDGFTLGVDSGSYVGGSSQATVSWNWKANGSGSANTDGSINSTVSANNTSGFSIVKYTGTGSAGNVGHGLSTAPTFLINKALGTQDWFVGCSALGFTKFLKLNETSAVSTNSGIWNDTAPTTDHFTINSANGNTNASGVDYITYCFADVQGYSKFGSYTGNGSTNGPFVYTGFKPAWVIFKKTSGTGGWNMFDTKRDPFNVQDQILRANLTNAEVSDSGYSDNDFLSNGFKIRQTWGEHNTSGGSYIYLAFAEAPLVTSTGIPATAR